MSLSGFRVLPVTVFLLFSSYAVFGQSAAGTVSPDARYLAIEGLDDFSEGVAIIRNDRSYALINSKAEILVPFNKYIFELPFHNGFITIQKQPGGNYAYMNRKLEVITPFIFFWDQQFDKDGYAFNRKDKVLNDVFDYNVSSTGALVPLFRRINGIRVDYEYRGMGTEIDYCEGLVAYSVKSREGKQFYGYVSRSGKIVIPAKYLAAGEFSEGLAPVASLSESGEWQWGFIDKTGKLVIPFQFRNKPGGFKNGLCYVKPLPNSGFDFAYIDKSGEVQFKVTIDKQNNLLAYSNGEPGPMVAPKHSYEEYHDLYRKTLNPFQGDYVYWTSKRSSIKMISKTGTISDLNELLIKSGLDVSPSQFNTLANKVVRNEHIIFNYKENMGMIRSDGKIILPPVFSSLGHFDPVSGLALATYNDAATQKRIEGYIDLTGQFVIVRKDKGGM